VKFDLWSHDATDLSPRPLVGFGGRRGLRSGLTLWPIGHDVGLWGRRRLEPRQRRAQRIEARGARKPVVFDGAPDRRRYGGVLVVGKINRRQGLASRPLSSKTLDPALDGGLIAVRRVHHPDHYQSVERRVVSIRMRLEIGGHAGDRVRQVAGVEVFKRSFSTPVEMLVARQCVSLDRLGLRAL